MADLKAKLSESDLDFVVNEAAPEFGDKEKLKQLVREDEAFRKGLIGDEKVFAKVMADEEILVKISPRLLFEILLRRALKELETATHTMERIGSQRVPVFDPSQVVKLLAQKTILEYLADMLSSFTRIESFTLPVRVRKGVWRKVRFNDLDVDSLSRLCEAVDEEYRFSFYKRIADVCLFILGIFPEYVTFDYRYPFSGEIRPKIAARLRRSAEEYEEEGRKFYRLAGEHVTSRILDLSEVLWQLAEKFNLARKPLNFISEHYLRFRREKLFGALA